LNGFSVDVEDWFHICGGGEALAPARWPMLPARVVETTCRLLDLLGRCDVRATFFVLGWIAERHPRLVHDIQSAGHEIGSHGHLHRRVYDLTDDEFARDLLESRAALRGAGVRAVTAFRAPEWSINDRTPRALDVLAANGFTLDSSMAPLRIVGNPAYPRVPHLRHTPAGPIRELPPFVGRRFGQQIPIGGSWGLRISRPAAVLRALEAVNRDGSPAVLWVHPWEVDPSPPRVRLPLPLWAAHYVGLHNFAERLETVLSGSRFAPLSEVAPVRPS
jgi:polysaccharide deacetylase family protein (PEP-CTERM system associated)